MELDHLFLRARAGAPEADALRAFGLAEGSANTHPGQGTANRRFFFRNAFIELIWVADEDEVGSAGTRRTQLGARLDASSAASPFGVCLRPSGAGGAAPFATWAYTPAYLPPGMAVDMALDAPLREPLWFYLEKAVAPEDAAPERRQPMAHAAGLQTITSVRITVPGKGVWSEAGLAVVAGGEVVLLQGNEHLLEIGFDGGVAGRVHDFRPALPLIFKY